MSALVQVLIQVEETKLDRTLECSSLFIYAMKYLELERAMRRKAAKPQEDATGVKPAESRAAKSADPFCRNRKPPARQPLSAEEKHAVFFKGQGRCTHIDSAGERCKNERYLEIHHIQPVSEGGSNELENLTLLCGVHHDMEHQLSFSFDEQNLRSPPSRGTVSSSQGQAI